VTQRLAVLPAAIALAIALAACSGAPEPVATETDAPTPTPEPTETQAPAEATFALPPDCTGLLSPERQQQLKADGRTLLGGPGGTYPQYYGDPTPEEQAGGISCIWGDEAVPQSLVTVSAAPLNAATRSQIVDTLLAQGLNEAVIDDGLSYAQLGDQTSAPAVLNIIRDDSWISVIEALGGEDRFDEAVVLAGEVADQVYRG
jgi:hypothetical protein